MSAGTKSCDLPVITIIGSLNADLTTYTSRIPGGGETLYANSFQTGSGGKGGNQASACAKLSRPRADPQNSTAIIKMIGAVGNDLYGRSLVQDLQSTGVDTTGVAVREDVETGVAVILVEETTGQNRILINAGANHTLTPEQFETIPLPLPALLIMQLEIPVATVVQVLRAAREAGVQVLLNPAPAVKLPEEAYAGLEHLVMNETEAAILGNCSMEEIEDDVRLPAVAGKFHGKGVKNVIITLGSRGVFYSKTGGDSGLIPAKRVQVVDTTAAGDTFVGAYALEAVKAGFDIEAAGRRANGAAALTIGKKGAQVSIPWADELGVI
jgi:ribokinase